MLQDPASDRPVFVRRIAMQDCACVIWQAHAGRGYYRQKIRGHVQSLRLNQPKSATAVLWDCTVNWTVNLHGESFLSYGADVSYVVPFEKRLRVRLHQRCDVELIV